MFNKKEMAARMKTLAELKKQLRLSKTGNPKHYLSYADTETLEEMIELIEETEKDEKKQLLADKAEWDKEIEER